MRLFIAIPIPPDVRRAVVLASNLLAESGARGRFVPQSNFHITLHYIGETDDLVGAVDALRLAVRDIRPFVLRLGDYGGFGGKKGRTTYLSVSCDTDELDNLYESLESALWEQGFAKNRGRLTPHITLARNVVGDEDFNPILQNVAFTADTVILYESRADGERMRYTAVHRERLS